MSILAYIKRKLERRKARRITKEYPSERHSFSLPKEGEIQFANWKNPLVKSYVFTQELIDFFKQFVPKGKLAIDIGANIGDTTVPMALAAGPEGLVIAFDPNPIVFKLLKENAGLNPGKQRIEPFQYAISDNESEYYFVSSEASFGNGGISPTRDSRHGRFVYPEKVRGINLEAFLKSNYPQWLDKLSFIKIDTEGFDKEIIKSISPLIKQYRPCLVAESFDKNTHAEKVELFNVVADMNYDIYYFHDFDINTQTEKLNSGEDLAKFKKTVNIYCIPRK